jgi:alkylation response protein AidB-like acyl-CoA dehydrogenase
VTVDLNLDDDQRLLADSARQLFERTYPTAEARKAEELPERFSRDLWTQMAELGWPGIALPEDCGGAGYGLLELAILAEELGRAAVTAPLVSSYAATLPLLWAGGEALRARWLGPLTTGDAIAALALLEPGARTEQASPSLTATPNRDGWALTGTKLAVRAATSADVFLVSADLGDGRSSLVAVPADAPGVARTAHATFSPEPIGAVTLTGVAVTAGDVVGERGAVAPVLERALAHLSVLDTAYAVGLCDAALALAVDHATNREQFGRPIGVNQAVSHQCVDIRVETDAMRVLAHQAAWRLDRHDADPAAAGRAVALANAYARDVIPGIFARAHQVHGAMGFTMEYDLQLFSRRAKSYELTGGGAAWHLERVATSLGL